MSRITAYTIIMLLTIPHFCQAQADDVYDSMMKAKQGLDEWKRALDEEHDYQKQQEAQRQVQDSRKMRALFNIYNSFESYPNVIKDGWHEVWMVDDINIICNKRQVYVESNKVTKYKNGKGYSVRLGYTPIIKKAKSTVELKFDDGSTQFVDLYFIDEIE